MSILIHFHLSEPIMVNKRKRGSRKRDISMRRTMDFQVYTDVGPQTEEISWHFMASKASKA